MKYISTRGNVCSVSSVDAIKMGMVPQGGLFVPEEIPEISPEQLCQWKDLSYAQLASCIFPLFLKDNFSENEIDQMTRDVYSDKNFESEKITPVKKLDSQTFVLELFHGPTGAFKDIALQVLPHLLTGAVDKLSIDSQMLVLVATSGDTGKASLEGFKNIPGTQVVVYYPLEKVSKIQELQMLTTDGNNTHVVAIRGNFDDCQNVVKEIFSDQIFCRFLQEKGFEFSSANSINWGRLFPQIVYYFYAYFSLLRNNEITIGEKINFVVPTGNFGNILAGWYAYRMGLPIEKLICASNANKVLTDFFHSGIYERNRPLVSTISPSMDILISSNLERFLYEISDHWTKGIVCMMSELQEKGQFNLDKKIKSKMDEIIFAGYASEKETLETIKNTYYDFRYLVDPHTAVGLKVFRDYLHFSGQKNKTVINATASPFKFPRSVLLALLGDRSVHKQDELALLEELSQYTGLLIPNMLQDLGKKKIKHSSVYNKENTKQSLIDLLKIT